MKRTESMFWRDLYMSEPPYNCTNPIRYIELKNHVIKSPMRSHRISEDVIYHHIVTLDFILSQINWGLCLEG